MAKRRLHTGSRNPVSAVKRGNRKDKGSTRFFSKMFLVPKKGGEWRPIINLKTLNRYIRAPRFKMTTIKDVTHLIQQGEWAVTLDLKRMVSFMSQSTVDIVDFFNSYGEVRPTGTQHSCLVCRKVRSASPGSQNPSFISCEQRGSELCSTWTIS